MKFNALMPELYVTDFHKSLHFYIIILGFKVEYQRSNPTFAFLSYGQAQLMIQELRSGEAEAMKLEHPFGRGINFEIETIDLTVIISSLEKNKYPISKEVKDCWRYIGDRKTERGSRELTIHDPDGYELRFSQKLGERSI